ncbi:MAG: hypothetical protein CMN76_13535 [Spirochaetaceae bacterium]|nr:hypothetical protein [Spirochaetaceae bacterium]|tara:strand:- start:563 stop:1012 length:450 start_codon:yes stop_codon:yes gene_type:complete
MNKALSLATILTLLMATVPAVGQIETGTKYCRVQTFSEIADLVRCINLIRRDDNAIVVQFLNYFESSISYNRPLEFKKQPAMESHVYYRFSEKKGNYVGLFILKDESVIVDNRYSKPISGSMPKVLEKRGVYYRCYSAPECPDCSLNEM